MAAVAGHGDAQQPDPKFGAATTAVVIDVVVRDAKGRPVTDLTRADFELLEDGVAQTLGDVTRVGAPARGAAPSRDAATRQGAASRHPPVARHAKTSPRQPFWRSSSIASRPKRARWRTRARWRRSRPARPTTLSACSSRTCRWCRFRPTPRTARSCARRLTRRPRARRRCSIATRSGVRRRWSTSRAGDYHPSVPVVASAESVGRPACESSQAAGIAVGGAAPPPDVPRPGV